MNKELSSFAAHLRELIANWQSAISNRQFSELALKLFALQFQQNPAYWKFCEARGLTPKVVEHWTQISAVPTSAFKELELSCIPANERAAVFHSSGTTEQKPSRHFHCRKSIELYEDSLWSGFRDNVLSDLRFTIDDLRSENHSPLRTSHSAVVLTPPPELAPHSSLVHMFETVRQKMGAPKSVFVGRIDADGSWTLDFAVALAALKASLVTCHPSLLLGTAFSFVHLLDYLVERDLRVELPAGSRVMETGGYKNRSRTMPKSELHALITERLGVSAEHIICEYGMSELSSQAYDVEVRNAECGVRKFHFPPWSRVQIVSPETGREVADGETGLIRMFDLANVFSVAAIQTEDLGIRRGDGFELIGRAQMAEPRGCSLMSESALRIPHSALK